MSKFATEIQKTEERFKKLFPDIKTNKIVDIGFTQLTMHLTNRAAIDILLLDDLLHAKYGDYEKEGLSMAQFIEKQYGKEAENFIEEHL